MMFKGGIKAAARMLQALSGSEREALLNRIKAQDPLMAQKLVQEMVQFEDLRHLNIKMLQELLRELPLDKFSLALRLGSKELREKILTRVSRGMKTDIESVLLGPPRPVDEVEKACREVMEVVIAKVERGELILRPEDEDECV